MNSPEMNSDTSCMTGARVAEVLTALDRDYAHLHDLYRYLHANPELSGQEENTASRLAAEMARDMAQAGCDLRQSLVQITARVIAVAAVPLANLHKQLGQAAKIRAQHLFGRQDMRRRGPSRRWRLPRRIRRRGRSTAYGRARRSGRRARSRPVARSSSRC